MSVPQEDVNINNMTRLIVNHTEEKDTINQTLMLDCSAEPFDPSAYFYWFDGILVAVLALVGTVGNVLALIVLARPRLRDVFHQLLFTLALFDLIYIICGGINYTFRAFRANSDVYTLLFPYFLYPITHVSMAGTIFTTLAISIERYLGLCHPMLPPHSRKAWFYVIPVVGVSFLLNTTKFMEVSVKWETDRETNETIPTYGPTDLRLSEDYVRYYIMWTRLFSTALIPVALLIFLNVRIIFDLFQSSKIQRFGSARRQRKEINLCFVLLAIVFVFFACHAARITLDVYEFSNLDLVIGCEPYWRPPPWATALLPISHSLMVLNSSANFFIYCLVGHTFRRELCRTFGVKSNGWLMGRGSWGTGGGTGGGGGGFSGGFQTAAASTLASSEISGRASERQRFIVNSNSGNCNNVAVNGNGQAKRIQAIPDTPSSSNAKISSYSLTGLNRQQQQQQHGNNNHLGNGDLDRLENKHGIVECGD